MAERRAKCSVCQSFKIEVVMVHNPDTTRMNSDATLKCTECQHTWMGKVTSEYNLMLRRSRRRR